VKQDDIKRLAEAISRLSAAELTAIKKALAKRERSVEAQIVEAEMAEAVKACPHCGGKNLKSAGSKGGRKRFKCKACGKTFNGFTGTPLSGLHNPDKFLANAKCMVKGLTVRQTAAAVGLDKDTAFRWRHRFLESLRDEQPGTLKGVVEADETFFLESFKGQRGGLPRKAKKRGTPAVKRGLSKEQIPVLVARDRAGSSTLSAVLPSRKGKDIAEALAPKLDRDTVLITDGATAYRAVAKVREGVEIRSVPANPKRKSPGPNHINNVNAYDRRLKEWMDRFHGVATRYLGNYLGWHRWLDAAKGKPAPRKFLEDAAKP
jgi:transposase-like protein